ncbi:HAMP domain-containing sensor histidine kinase [Clostridium sp.]|uniref:sensor histidine kinase n=1 Tax=Clostridium sp. TaxID=1506 RepID=UPI003216A553
MKSNFNKIKNIILTVIIIMCISFNIVLWLLTKDIKITIISLSFSITIVLLFYLYERLFHNYMEDILVKLSDMLATIADMKETEVFSTIEDSLFSKLQNQTIKITKMSKAQNKKIQADKNEIKALISDIAHQLKTPLTNLKMYGEFLLDDSISEEERKEFSEIMMISLNKLSFLVESMIKMSRLESEVIQLNPSKESLTDTVLLAIKQIHRKAKDKRIDINFHEIDRIEVVHDKNWTTEALFNILDNAVKYTGCGGTINVTVQSYEIFVRIDLEDNGIGILEEETPKIFSRFYRGQNVGEEEGIGIGLYLSREIISRQGGYIKVKSSDENTMFSVFLPRDMGDDR